MVRIKHWQDPLNAIVGGWLVVSPWILGFSNVGVAASTTVAVGVLLVATAVGAMQFTQAWEEWLEATLGIALMLLPALFGFDTVVPALKNALACGALVTFLALWVLASDDVLAGWWERNVG